VTKVDWVALGFVALAALVGWRKGLIGSAFSAAGILAGAIIGGRLAPHLLHGGSRSPYTPLAALAGAAFLAIVFEAAGSIAGATLRQKLRLTPLRLLDSAGGLAVGAAAGFALVWVVAAVAVYLPGQTELRQGAQRSFVVRRLNELAPPSRVLSVLASIDPFPSIIGPAAPVASPDPRLLRRPGVRQAAPSVVRVVGRACGLAVEGSGWGARPGLVVTAAHVVAGEHDTAVETSGHRNALPAVAVAFDSRNAVAVLRVSGLRARPLPLVDAEPGTAVAILGYPNDGPFSAVPGRIGRTAIVLTQNAYGHGPVTRRITSLRGRIRHGNSGGPAVDGRGRVQTTVFAARIDSQAGYGVPADPVRKALAIASGPVSTGGCVGGS
jgi:uncharacterized membrane protein required for colicin V production